MGAARVCRADRGGRAGPLPGAAGVPARGAAGAARAPAAGGRTPGARGTDARRQGGAAGGGGGPGRVVAGPALAQCGGLDGGVRERGRLPVLHPAGAGQGGAGPAAHRALSGVPGGHRGRRPARLGAGTDRHPGPRARPEGGRSTGAGRRVDRGRVRPLVRTARLARGTGRRARARGAGGRGRRLREPALPPPARPGPRLDRPLPPDQGTGRAAPGCPAAGRGRPLDRQRGRHARGRTGARRSRVRPAAGAAAGPGHAGDPGLGRARERSPRLPSRAWRPAALRPPRTRRAGRRR